MRTLIPGSLTILSAYPDPPFDIMKDGVATGFDIKLMRAVCGRLSLELRPLAYNAQWRNTDVILQRYNLRERSPQRR